VELLCESGKAMASGHTNMFLQKAAILSDNPSPVIQEILITSYVAVPAQFADDAIRYLLADTGRFASGTGYDEPKWAPAVRLLRAQSPYCSEILFKEIETAITHYHEPEERALAELYLPRWKDGYWGAYWGEAQYFLLPALCEKRRSDNTNGLIGVLKRKLGHLTPAV
jgi:hypothetical protein